MSTFAILDAIAVGVGIAMLTIGLRMSKTSTIPRKSLQWRSTHQCDHHERVWACITCGQLSGKHHTPCLARDFRLVCSDCGMQ